MEGGAPKEREERSQAGGCEGGLAWREGSGAVSIEFFASHLRQAAKFRLHPPRSAHGPELILIPCVSSEKCASRILDPKGCSGGKIVNGSYDFVGKHLASNIARCKFNIVPINLTWLVLDGVFPTGH